jgi:DNA mismatch repair protein MutS2
VEKERLLSKHLNAIEDERLKLLKQTQLELDQKSREFQMEIDSLRKELLRAHQPIEALKSIQQHFDESIDQHSSIEPLTNVLPIDSSVKRYKPGMKVRIRSLQMDGTITSISEMDVEVQVGSLRVRARVEDLQKPNEIEKTKPEIKASKPKTKSTAAQIFHPSPGMEIDLRGQRAEDAQDALDRYLESAFLAGMPFVRIIHGRGTGRLRQVLRDLLKQNPHVKRFEDGKDNEGGDGVTIAHLKTD